MQQVAFICKDWETEVHSSKIPDFGNGSSRPKSHLLARTSCNPRKMKDEVTGLEMM
jgi:hypothetical protein